MTELTLLTVASGLCAKLSASSDKSEDSSTATAAARESGLSCFDDHLVQEEDCLQQIPGPLICKLNIHRETQKNPSRVDKCGQPALIPLISLATLIVFDSIFLLQKQDPFTLSSLLADAGGQLCEQEAIVLRCRK